MSPQLLTTVVLVVATLYFGKRWWGRFRKNKPKKPNEMLANPGHYRIFAILGIIFFFFILGFVIYGILARILN
jgi:ABC-type Fe3+ transport system permease subunit